MSIAHVEAPQSQVLLSALHMKKHEHINPATASRVIKTFAEELSRDLGHDGLTLPRKGILSSWDDCNGSACTGSGDRAAETTTLGLEPLVEEGPSKEAEVDREVRHKDNCIYRWKSWSVAVVTTKRIDGLSFRFIWYLPTIAAKMLYYDKPSMLLPESKYPWL